MALHWNAEATPWAALPTEEKEELRPILDVLIWATIAVGIGEITEANLEEWTERYVMIYTAYGEKPECMRLVVTNLPLFVGLHTNVFPKESKAKFKTKLYEVLARNAGKLITAAKAAETVEVEA